MHEVLVNRLEGLSLPRKSVVRLTDRPDMNLDVYRGRKTTTQPTNQKLLTACTYLVHATVDRNIAFVRTLSNVIPAMFQSPLSTIALHVLDSDVVPGAEDRAWLEPPVIIFKLLTYNLGGDVVKPGIANCHPSVVEIDFKFTVVQVICARQFH